MATKRGRSRIRRVLRAGLLLVLLVVLLPLVVAVCFIAFEIPLNLSPFRPRLQALASKSLKRDVALEGSVRVTLRRSLAAEIEMENVRISGKDPEVNPALLDAGRIEAGVWLPPLRKKRIVLSVLELENAEFTVQPKRKKSRPEHTERKEEVEESPSLPDADKSEREEPTQDYDLIGIDRIRLSNVLVRHTPRKSPAARENVIKLLEGTAATDRPLKISMSGVYQGKKAEAELEIFDPIDEIMDMDHASTSSIHLVVGESLLDGRAVFDFSGEVPSVTVDAATRSPSLNTLGLIFEEDWPDVGPVDGSLTFFHTRERRKVENIRAKMGSTFLTGYIHMTRDKQREMYFTAEEAVLSDVFKVIDFDGQGLEGTVNRVEFKLTQPGGTRAERKRNRAFLVTAQGGRLQYEYDGREYLTLDVQDLQLSQTPEVGDVFRLDGAWLGEEVILEAKRGHPREEPRDDRREVELRLEGAGTRLRVDGLLRGKRINKETDLDVSLASESVGRLNLWLDVNPECDLPLEFHTRLRRTKESLGIDALEITLGENNLSAEFSQAKQGGVQSIFARLASDHLNVDEISDAGFHNILNREKKKPRQKEPAGDAARKPEELPPEADQIKLELDIPVWPDPIDIPDVDIDCEIKRFVVGSEVMDDLRISGKSANGDVEHAAVTFGFGETKFDGRFSLKLSQDIPVGTLDVVAENVDVSDLLTRRQITEGTKFRAERFELRTVGRGTTAAELLRWSDFSVDLHNGRYTYTRSPGADPTEVVVERASARALRGEPVSLDATGTVGGEPVSIALRSDLSREQIHELDHIPLELDLTGSGVELNLRADANLPFDKMAHTLDFRIAGESLHNVATNYVRLPRLGPYELSGHLDIDDEGYRLSNLKLALASSGLNGSVSLALNRERPRFDIILRAPAIQLDELYLSDWVNKKDKTNEKKEDADDPAEKRSPETEKEKKPGTMEYLLANVDGHISLTIDEVASGGDLLGAGVFEATLENGRVDLDPLYVAFGDGEFELAAAYEEITNGISAELRLKARQFDYGVLARRLDRKTDMAGRISIDAEIMGEGSDWEDLVDHANGCLHLGVFPDNLDASILDMWAANLIMALARKADDPKNSKFNCLMGRFVMEDGLITDRTLVLDTTRVRVKGTVKIDLQNDDLRLKLKPRSKRPMFFSLETPITVKGSLDKPEISLNGWDVTKSVGGFVLSIVTVPIRWLSTDPLPKDGRDICTEWEEMMK